MDNYISTKGFSIFKDNFSLNDLEIIRKELTVKPFVNKNFTQDAKPFKIYKESKKKLYIPRYYGLNKFGEVKSDKMNIGKEINIKFNSELREKQKPVVKKYLEECKKGRGGIISVPCGFGKTVLSLYIVSKLKRKTIVIVHKEFLLNQWKERIEFFLPEAKIGKLQGNIINIKDKDIVIGMLQSISMKEYDENIFKEFGLVIYDECHHLGAEVFSKSLYKVPCKYTLGLSATPDRNDGLTKVFKWFLGDVVYLIKKREQEDVIVKIIRYYNDDDKYSKVLCNYRGQINMPNMITNICMFKPRNIIILKYLKECLEEKRKILVLSDRRKHLEFLKELIDTELNCTSGFYLGGLKHEVLKETEKKDIMLGTFSMASEGFDCKELDTIIFSSPKSNIEQSVGRILRKKKEDRDKIPLVIDIIDDFNIFSRQGEKRLKFYKKNKYKINEIIIN